MSIAKRKQDEKLEMHKRILNAARKIFLENGYEKTSIRTIANEIDYSPGTIYFYFKDKGEIFQELHREGFQLLVNQLKEYDTITDPFKQLKEQGLVLIKFAQNHTDYYNLMFLVNEPKKGNSEGFQIAQEAIEFLSISIKKCQEQGRFKDQDANYFTFMILSAIHGICSLFCKDRMGSFFGKTNEELMKHGYECFVSLLENS